MMLNCMDFYKLLVQDKKKSLVLDKTKTTVFLKRSNLEQVKLIIIILV
jgi:hypothetical protein